MPEPPCCSAAWPCCLLRLLLLLFHCYLDTSAWCNCNPYPCCSSKSSILQRPRPLPCIYPIIPTPLARWPPPVQTPMLRTLPAQSRPLHAAPGTKRTTRHPLVPLWISMSPLLLVPPPQTLRLPRLGRLLRVHQYRGGRPSLFRSRPSSSSAARSRQLASRRPPPRADRLNSPIPGTLIIRPPCRS